MLGVIRTVVMMSIVCLAAARALAAEPAISLTIDATDLPRNLIKTVQSIQTPPAGGPLDLRYCIWTPGNHNPSGPIENVVNLIIQDCKGNRLHWDRDPTQVDRLTVTVPQGCTFIDVKADYIASQPSVNSRSSDSYGKPNLGAINFNTLLIYPANTDVQKIDVQTVMFIPQGWKAAWALPFKTHPMKMEGGAHAVAVIALAKPAMPELIDSPIIFGEHLSTADLACPEGVRPHTLHVAAAEARYTEVPDSLVKQLEGVVRESVAIFGSYPRSVYRFLILAGDGMGWGLEHAESTFIGVGKDEISGATKTDLLGGGGKLLVLPHEYFHVWCGKLRAPEGLITGDFTTPARTELLWAYEGLTAYYDMVLGARSGMITTDEFRQEVLSVCATMEQRSGRLWRSVEDTARAARFLRPRGTSWYEMRRGQDYYSEAALFWLEADALIRAGTSGTKSLDDFCRDFFNVPVKPIGAVATYSRADVVAALKTVYDAPDWDALIRERVERPVATLDFTPLLQKIGYRIEYAATPTDLQRALSKNDDGINLRTSLGCTVGKDGTVNVIIPGSPADRAGMRFTAKIIGVDGWTFTPDRLRDAVKNSSQTKRIELLTTFDDRLEPLTFEYDGGPRIPRLVRIDGTDDLLEKIATPRAPAAGK